MTIKNIDYYLGIDLDHAADAIRAVGTNRGNSREFTEAITAISLRSERQSISSDELIRVLGAPDLKRPLPEGREVWEYHWTGMHGPSPYVSLTPFEIEKGRVIGLLAKEIADTLCWPGGKRGQSVFTRSA